MQTKMKSILVLSILLMVALTGVAAGSEQKTKITYIAYSDAYSENEALEIASQSCDHSDLIEYTFIEYGNSTYGASQELLMAAESGFLETQDVIFCDMMGSKTFNAYNGTINDSFKSAQDNGAELYSIRTSSTPSYFDYIISGAAYPDPICTYYQAIDTTEEGIENAENFLMYLTMKKRITYIAYSDAYSENEAFELAMQSSDESDMIEYTFIEYGNSTYGASQELLMSAESGFLETQDVIFCDMMGSKTFNAYNGTINDSFKSAQ
ncbi:cobalamin biosynthesis Mg chelatase CobN, partial [Methanolobus bombayensis]|nr:cobalamin biosynthesis Mg chelatase CobN [Methanolobus bombayensis]